jgi:GT2 family glycosyltransferase
LISVVIVNFNAGDLLTRTIGCLKAAVVDRALEIIVVDNASRDGSTQGLLDYATDRRPITLIANARNLGFATACNQGAALARGEHLLFLNPDCAVTPEAIAVTLEALEAAPRAAMAGCLLLNEDGSEQRGCRRRIPDLSHAWAHVSGLSRWFPRRFADFNEAGSPLPDAPVAVEAISGAFMLIKRRAFEAVGRWDEAYFLHCEDLDLCQRVRDHGHEVLFVPAARAVHRQGASSRDRLVRVEWHKHWGMWRFYRKFQADERAAMVSGLVGLGIGSRFLLKACGLLLRVRQPGSPA